MTRDRHQTHQEPELQHYRTGKGLGNFVFAIAATSTPISSFVAMKGSGGFFSFLFAAVALTMRGG